MPSNNKVNNKSTTTRTNRVDKSHPRSPATGATATSNSRRATTGRKIESGKISYEVAQYNEPGSSQYEEEPVQYLQDESFYTGVPTYLTYHDLQQSNVRLLKIFLVVHTLQILLKRQRRFFFILYIKKIRKRLCLAACAIVLSL